MDIFSQAVLSNVLISAVLAVLAFVVGITLKRPHLTHMLYLIVLVKLITPPVVTFPVVTISEQFNVPFVSSEISTQTNSAVGVSLGETEGSIITWLRGLYSGKNGLLFIWLSGSVSVLGLSLVRIYRFNRQLKAKSEIAPHKLLVLAENIAEQLGMHKVPTIYTTKSKLSPMVWWIGGRVRIIFPEYLFEQMDGEKFQWVLAHELAHVKRRDFIVRWLEWVAVVGFWWNPVVYWARYNLRANEELCCDALVVSALKPKPHAYADSLLNAVEILASPMVRVPGIASEMNSGGFLEKRFRIIISFNPKQSKLRYLQMFFIVGAMAALPLGVGCETGTGLNPTAPTETASLQTDDGVIDRESELNERHMGMADNFNKLGVDAEMFRVIRNYLTENDFTEEQLEGALGGMLRIVYEVNSEGEEFELDLRLRDYFENTLGLSKEQIEIVIGISKRIAFGKKDEDSKNGEGNRDTGIQDHFERIGVSAEALDGIRSTLKRSGFSAEQTEISLGAMTRIIPEIKIEGKEFELDVRLRSYLENELRLSGEQIEVVVGISRRIVNRMG